jgi:hypothetical protein
LTKTVSLTVNLLNAEDAARNQNESLLQPFSELLDDQQRPTVAALNAILRSAKKIQDASQLMDLVNAFEDEEEGLSFRFLKLCESVVRSTDCVDACIAHRVPKSSAASVSPRKKSASSQDDSMVVDKPNETPPEFDVEEFERKLERTLSEVFLGLEACALALHVILGSYSTLTGPKKVRLVQRSLCYRRLMKRFVK